MYRQVFGEGLAAVIADFLPEQSTVVTVSGKIDYVLVHVVGEYVLVGNNLFILSVLAYRSKSVIVVSVLKIDGISVNHHGQDASHA